MNLEKHVSRLSLTYLTPKMVSLLRFIDGIYATSAYLRFDKIKLNGSSAVFLCVYISYRN